jgi:membrane-bound serine protease (ClpP class)
MLTRWTVAALAVLFLAAASGQEADEPSAPFVVVCPIEDMIDEGISVIVKRAVAEAVDAEALIFIIDTPGGRVDSAIDISNTILSAQCPTIAYAVGMGAISAGALISFACDDIVLSPEANIGAATPVIPSVEGMQPTSEKEVSFVRAKFRALAETKGHSVALAEAMVDEDIALRGYTNEDGEYVVYRVDQLDEPGEDADAEQEGTPLGEVISPAGSLLTLTAQEALKYGLIETTARSSQEVIDYYGYGEASVRTIEFTWAEALFRWLTSPTITGLLLLLGIGGLYFELQTPGFGITGIIGLCCLALFFGSHMVLGLADWLDVAFVLLGVALIVLEVFVLPGFGITGVAGFIMLFAGIYLALTRVPVPQYSWDYQRLADAGYSITVAMGGLLMVVFFTWRLLPHTPLYRKLVLTGRQDTTAGYVVQTEEDESAVGLQGVALTMLRPAGRGRFNDKTYDIVSRAEYIEQGSPVVIVEVDGNRYVVERAKEQG